MEQLIIIATLFVVGSVAGWILEVFYRRFVSQKKWMNPGFLVGPYLPIYGFGIIVLYVFFNYMPKLLNLIGLVNPIWQIVVEILLIGIAMTLIELVAGLIFINGMHIKLWDYSDRWGNFKGVICPLYSLLWLIGGGLYYFLLNDKLVNLIQYVSDNLAYSFFVGGVIGAILVDTAYSIHLGVKISSFAKNNKLVVYLDELRQSNKRAGEAKQNFWVALKGVHSREDFEMLIAEYKKNQLNKKKEKEITRHDGQ